MNENFSYPGLDITQNFSTDIFDVNYHSGSEDISLSLEHQTLIQNFISETDREPLFKCLEGYHRTSSGPITFTCDQTSSDYISGNTNDSH